ncbi:TPA: hypothetical protein RQM97_003339 [Aeromonas dhakensis]|nr:hypothetical protein [Aeromonas dhakensis]
MIVTFVICEGPHDAYFVGRLISQAQGYTVNENKLSDYPKEISEFILQRLASESADEIRLGKFSNPTIPICSYLNGENMVLPISVGGMNKVNEAKKLVADIVDSFNEKVLAVNYSTIKKIRMVFVYDADSRGVEETKRFFETHFLDIFDLAPENITIDTWIDNARKMPISLFIFREVGRDTGTLEDSLIGIFREQEEELVEQVRNIIDNRFEALGEHGDAIAYAAKKNKAILTACGQLEKRNAGSALTVVIRDTKLLDGVFNSERATPWQSLGDLFSVE